MGGLPLTEPRGRSGATAVPSPAPDGCSVLVGAEASCPAQAHFQIAESGPTEPTDSYRFLPMFTDFSDFLARTESRQMMLVVVFWSSVPSVLVILVPIFTDFYWSYS